MSLLQKNTPYLRTEPPLSAEEEQALIARINNEELALQDLNLSMETLLRIAPHLTCVDLRGENFDSLPQEPIEPLVLACRSAQKLYIKNPNLTRLPALPQCTELYCSNCTNLQQLPELPLCTTLWCSGCSNLQQLPVLAEEAEVHSDNCPNLE